MGEVGGGGGGVCPPPPLGFFFWGGGGMECGELWRPLLVPEKWMLCLLFKIFGKD